MTKEQKKLIEIVKKLGRRGPDSISVGPNLGDVFGRKLDLSGQAMDESGTKLSGKTLALLKELQAANSETEKVLRGQVMWYDVRSSVWMENPELSALFALAYASVLVQRSGKKTGHTLNVAVDCYPKHFTAMSIFVDTITRTGIFKDGGGIIYWGVQNGGAIRNVSMYERALTGKGGNWVYSTMSHRKENYIGAKFGVFGNVFVGPDLMKDLYGKLVRSDFPPLVKIENPADFIVNVKNLTNNNIDILEDLIRARTGTDLPKEKILEGIKVGLNMSGSPVGKNLVEILRAFGADVLVENEQLSPNFDTSNIIDPNEHESGPVGALRRKAEQDGRIYIAVDPDGDRGSFVAVNSEGKAESLTGTELLILATENLATYNPKKLPNDVIYDMRTGISIAMFAEALKKKNVDIKLIASEPGYPFFMENMGKFENAVVAVENTAHAFMTPLTNPIWGAPEYHKNIQGGDDAAIFLTYLLALSNLKWDKRNPVQELEHLRAKYGIPKTIIREFKPTIGKEDALRKYDLARKMCEIAKRELSGQTRYEIDTMNSGARITDKERHAMVLVRYSNTGPSFTASGEAITKEDSDFMFSLGGAIMNLAVRHVKKEKGDFSFDWGNFAEYGDIPEEKAEEIIKAR